ncbi:hypothetical protein ACXFAT_21030 [Cronobacter dublinensis]|nr:hypothetical protein [Cronobacter dublinensis]MDI7504141.1 hypothetical protein [Cronobacter dublinensis]
MPPRNQTMQGHFIITTQKTLEMYGCAEGLSMVSVNGPKMKK